MHREWMEEHEKHRDKHVYPVALAEYDIYYIIACCMIMVYYTAVLLYYIAFCYIILIICPIALAAIPHSRALLRAVVYSAAG